MAAVFDENLPSSEKLVLLAMADHADDAGGNCFPSIPRIARKSSMTRRGVQKVLRRLEEKNKIRAVGRRSDGTVEYAITLQGGERYSRGERSSRRTEDAGGANQSAKGGERGSSESSVTVIESPKGAQAQNRPSPSLAFRGVHLMITEKQDRLLGEAFPWIDRQSEYRKMDSWLEANTESRPKKHSRFAHNWFQRNSPKGGFHGHRKQSASDLAIQNARTLGLDRPVN
jgi:DNA-binding MarR family transcriptional regulator